MPTIGGIKRAGEPRKRGSQPGVQRGPYKPRTLKKPEPTAKELERWCRDYWGDEKYDAGYLVIHHRTYKPVSVRRYLPPDSMFSPDHVKEEHAPAGWKKCRGCGVELELSDFGTNDRGGHKARCKTCLAEAAREYQRTPEGKVARARAEAQYRKQLKAEESRVASRNEFIGAMCKSEKGRALLASIGVAPEAPNI